MRVTGDSCSVMPGLMRFRITRSRAAAWASCSICGFWLLRLYCQWFVYQPRLWRGKPLETFMHYWFTLVWIFLVAVFGACAAVQLR